MISNKDYKFIELKNTGKPKYLPITTIIEKKTARSLDLVIYGEIMDTVHMIL